MCCPTDGKFTAVPMQAMPFETKSWPLEGVVRHTIQVKISLYWSVAFEDKKMQTQIDSLHKKKLLEYGSFSMRFWLIPGRGTGLWWAAALASKTAQQLWPLPAAAFCNGLLLHTAVKSIVREESISYGYGPNTVCHHWPLIVPLINCGNEQQGRCD